MSASFSNSTMPVSSSITSASRALVSKAPAAGGGEREREAEAGDQGSAAHARTPGVRRAAAPPGDRRSGAAVKIYLWLYRSRGSAAQRGNAHPRRLAPRCRARRRPRWTAGSRAAAARREQRDDDLGAGREVHDHARSGRGRPGPPPRARRLPSGRSRTAGASRVKTAGSARSSKLQAEAARPAARRRPGGRSRRARQRWPAPAQCAAPSRPCPSLPPPAEADVAGRAARGKGRRRWTPPAPGGGDKTGAAGGVAERSIAPVLKTGEGASLPWVRIPPPPPIYLASQLKLLYFNAALRALSPIRPST